MKTRVSCQLVSHSEAEMTNPHKAFLRFQGHSLTRELNSLYECFSCGRDMVFKRIGRDLNEFAEFVVVLGVNRRIY